MVSFFTAFLAMPAFVKILCSFAGILLVYRLKLSLGLSIMLFALVLSIWSGTGLGGLWNLAASFRYPENWLLVLDILFLLFFTEALNKSGRMERTSSALKNWLSSRRMLIGGLPALIGLLPMPGGAIVSAPLVDSMDAEKKLPGEIKAAINYWFRHIWEYWWPLYPGVILAIKYSGLPVGTYLLLTIPFTGAAVFGGWLFILRKVPKGSQTASHTGKLNIADASETLLPIGILVLTAVTGSAVMPSLGIPKSAASLSAMFLGILLALSTIFLRNPPVFSQSAPMLFSKKTWALVMVFIGVQAFSSVLKLPVGAETLVSAMRDEFMSFGIPIILVIMLLPCIAGFVTGIAVGYVGITFPLVFALLGVDPSFNAVVATTILAYSSGYLGMTLSPIHVCFVVTNEYFESPVSKTYPYIIGPAFVVLLFAILYSSLCYLLFR
jgi:integral membrane protein (TIGR00529 family)